MVLVQPKQKGMHSHYLPDHCSIDSSIDITGIGKVPILSGDHHLLPDKAKDFLVEQISIMRPTAVFICTGTVFEADTLRELLIDERRLQRIGDYADVYTAHATECDKEIKRNDRVFIEEDEKFSREQSKPNSRLRTLDLSTVSRRARDELRGFFDNCMRGRTLFVVPFSVGPIGARNSINAVQLTDCPFTVLTTRTMSRVSSAVWDAIGTGDFIRCVHSVGVPRPTPTTDLYWWPSNRHAFISLNLSSKRIFSFGTAHFANNICRASLSLRMAAAVGRDAGWQAEFASIIGITDPSGEEIFACVQGAAGTGKNTIALLQSTLPGWKVRPISSQYAWLRWNADGRLYAMSPENGFCLQWSYSEDMKDKQPIEAAVIRKRSLLMNVKQNDSGDLHWVGRDDNQSDISNGPRPKSCGVVFASDVESIHPDWDSPAGVPISAYIFLVNRPSLVPVLSQSESWKDGISFALSTRTMKGTGLDKEALEHNPLGMMSFYPYGLPDYAKQWYDMEQPGRKMPKVFHMNLFRRCPTHTATSRSPSNTSVDSIKSDNSAAFDKPFPPASTPAPKTFTTCWPGFGDNIRLLQWIHGRTTGKDTTTGQETLIGTVVPTKIDVEGLRDVDWNECVEFDAKCWKDEFRTAEAAYDDTTLHVTEYDLLHRYIERVKAAINTVLSAPTTTLAGSAPQAGSKPKEA